ncbi:MAG: type II toxin-antitoxin system HicB family antitoxin [Coriobacteriales bacterium]|jgi:antitoxin HicB|nr:type II toxin-antitoxin system HicB family antitoxin [Coriobacteriales bacterium]
MSTRFIYEAEFKDDSGGYFVSFPQLPDAFTQGDDFIQATERAAEVLQLVIASSIDTGETLPEPVFKGYCEGTLRTAVSVEVTPDLIERSKCVTVTEAAEMLGVTKGRVAHMLDDGVLQPITFSDTRLVTLASINNRLANPRKAGRPSKSLTTA